MNVKYEWLDWNNKDSIEKNIQEKPQQDEDKILKYLKSGHPVVACASSIRDCFKSENRISTNLYTDWEWEWHDALIYYVENYHYKVSQTFLDHMKKKNWQIN